MEKQLEQELVAFFSWFTHQYLSPHAVMLLFTLLIMKTKGGWQEKFEVPHLVLQVLTRLSSKDIAAAIIELTKHRMLLVEVGTGKLAPGLIYQLVPMTTVVARQTELDAACENKSNEAIKVNLP
ncbi:hypothetical protein [Radiobacillus sp. PE A8.2]|uniref:hypothetical protein n=1 Tax=Radiobacillus sp. PE A8.2 TaxID=3380349 RepID=UPI00388FE509